MSETAPERGSGNPWTQRLGPLPLWAWAGVILGAALVFMYLRRNASGPQSGDTSASGTDTTDTGDESSQVPQFVNQTYTTVEPPAEEPPPVNITVPPNTPPATVTTPPTTTPTQKKKKVGTLGPPGNIHATRVTSSSIAVAWNKVSGASGYTGHLTYQEPNSGKAGVIGTQSTSGTSMTFGHLGADHTYTVHIATRNSAGTGSESNGPAVKTTR